jgi:hypothetical protein
MTNAKQLSDAIMLIAQHVQDTGMDVNIESGTVQVHWNGVNRLECSASEAGKALVLLKQLENMGMKDC